MQSGQTVRFMFEDSPIGMCSVMIDGSVLRRNSACEALFGATATSLLDLVADRDRHDVVLAMQAVHDGRQRAFRLAVDALAGRRIEISGIPMRGGTGDLMLHLVDISEHHQREETLRDLAEHDALTGLLNRLSFNRALSERVARRPCGTLMILDLDGFKRVNDTYGHQTGDAVLVVVAQALRAATADGDLIARLGGDEFGVLLASEMTTANAAGAMIIRRITIAAGIAARGLPVTASIGVVGLMSGVAPNELLEAADRAMYAGKRAGKGRCVMASMGAGRKAKRAS
ncbi:MAG: hypothetical protein NVSMB64_19090 [Candidatus Velthaea sp.]